MNSVCKSGLIGLCGLLVVACDSDNDAKELRNRVTVATQNYTVVAIQSANTVLEANRTYSLALLAGVTEANIDQTSDAIWSSSDTSVATVNSRGELTAISDGTVTITSDFGSLTDSVDLRVSSAPLTSIAIQAPEMLNECDSTQLSATGLFAADNGGERDITDSVNWSVATTPQTVGVFSGTTDGLFRSSGSGTAVITATRDDLSANANIEISDNLVSLAITPQAPVITTTVNTQFTATAGYSDVTESLDVTDNASWSVSSTSVASIDNTPPDKGLLNAISNSNVTLSVTCGGVSANVALEVGDPSIVESIRFGREDNPFEFDFSGETVVQLNAFARLQTQDEVNITQDVDWITVRRSTTALSLSDDTGSKGELTVSGRGSITVRIEYDGDDFDDTNSTFNTPTLVINVL